MKEFINKACAFILALLLLIPVSASAEEYINSFDYVGALVSEGVTTKLRDAILQDDDIFFPAMLYGTLAGCEAIEGVGEGAGKYGYNYPNLKIEFVAAEIAVSNEE